MKARYPALLILSLGLGACTTQVPVPTSYPMTFQPKIQAAHHWDMVAASVAQRLQEALPPTSANTKPVVLSVTGQGHETAFEQAFHGMLVTHLMARGYGVSHNPNVGLPITAEVQAVKHRSPAFEGTSLNPTAGPMPKAEVIVTTSVMNGDRYLARISDVYYIDDKARGEYLVEAPPATRRMELVSQ